MPTDGERRTRRKTKLKRGDILVHGDLVLTVVSGTGARVLLEAPVSDKYAVIPKKGLTKGRERS